MEFWITIVGLLRRKRVIIPAVLVAAALGAAAYLGTPVTYVSSTTMILTTTEYGGTESQDPATPDRPDQPDAELQRQPARRPRPSSSRR